MRRACLVVAVGVVGLALLAGIASAQSLPLIGERAPSFDAVTTQGPMQIPDKFMAENKWIVLFSHPADFTPVCTTEFMTFASRYADFQAHNCELVGLSVDGNASHIAWLRTIEEKLEWNGMKNVKIQFPLVADTTGRIASMYGMLMPSASTTATVRAVFFIDPKGIVKALLYYPLTNGRNIDEILRLLIALQTTDEYKVATPANWHPGDEVIVGAPGTMAAAQERVDTAAAQGIHCIDWFLCFKKLEEKPVKPEKHPKPEKSENPEK